MRTRKTESVPDRRHPLVLPKRRLLVTYEPTVVGPHGEHVVEVGVGRVVDGGPVVEVWVDLHKEGAPLRGFAHALARLASLALQSGTPLAVVVRALHGTDGGPGGAVRDVDGVTEAESIPDLVGRVLAAAGGVELPPGPEPLS